MSNILNLKGVKFFAIIVLAVAILATFGMVATTANAQQATVSASDIQYAATVRQGSSGEATLIWQKFLNNYSSANLVADGNFGPLTAAAARIWQASRNLSADGVLGAMSRASAVTQINAGVTNPIGGMYPAGCSSFSGYSVSTGLSCAGGTNLPSGCTSTSGYSITTGQLCSGGVNLPAGCSSTAGYSPTTGTKCDSTAGTPDSGGPLVGGAGDITVTELSTPSSSTKVGEGENDVKVLGIEVEADDESDIAVTSMRFTLAQSDTDGSDKLNRYAESVSVWMGSTKVGSADVSEFSESSGTYTKSISLSNAIVRAGDTAKFYLAVDAIADIDSGNTGSSENLWTATLTSTRFEDATGVVLTDSTASIANTHIYDTLSATGDVELKVGLSSSTVTAKTVKLSTTTDTSQVELMKFTIKAQGSSMFIDQIPVLFTSSETTIGDIMSNVTLVIDGETFNESVSGAAGATQTILFNNLGINVDADDTITGTVYADMNDIETTTFDEGTTLNAAITSALVVAVSSDYIDVEDENGDQLVTGDRTGSAQGNTLTFRSTGVNTVMGTPTYTTATHSTSGDVLTVVYTIPVAVTSFGSTLYLGQTAQLAAAATASNAFAYVFQNSATPTVSDVGATATATISTVAVGSDPAATIEGTSYRLDDGQTKHFVIEVTLTTPSAAGSFRVALKEIRTFDASTWLTGTSSALTPAELFQTGYKYIAS